LGTPVRNSALSDNLRPVGAVRKVKFNYYT
jgi:hypothetical protein